MRIDENKLKCVVYLYEQSISDTVAPEPQGTGFFVGLPIDGGGAFLYIVTARHVIERASSDTIIVRWNTVDGFEDWPTERDDWWTSDDADVAAIRAKRDPRGPSVEISAVPPIQFITDTYRYVGPPADRAGVYPDVGTGDTVFFVGMFSETWGRQKNLPVARFGVISRMPSEPMVFERFPEPALEEFEALAYLVEARSWGGHSGSPAFWVHPWAIRHEIDEIPGGFWDQEIFMVGLLGLVSAHYDIETEAKAIGNIIHGSIVVPQNSGMAVVTPAEDIRRLLMSDDVKKDREKTKSTEKKPTMDTANRGISYNREDFMRDLTKVTQRRDDESEKEQA